MQTEMDIIFYFIFLIMWTFVKSASNESEDLIEKCTSPWTSYNTKSISPLKCRNKCGKGKAFHSKEGKLICFNEKGLAHAKPHSGRRSRSSKNIKCECGYFLPSMRLQWLPCEAGNNILETTVEVCEQICERTTVYLYKLGIVRTVVFCENEVRLKFYDMAGQNGEVIYYENNSKKVKYRQCTCGIASMVLKTAVTVEKLKNSAVSFQKCSKPWETLELWKISILETCKIHCQLVCKRGSGIIHKGEAFCFMRYATAKKRTSFYGAVEGTCECGYIKKNNELCTREFIPCNPPITRNGLSGKKCDEFCLKSTVYIYKKAGQQLNIRCIYEPEMKPKSLAGKCDERIYQETRKNSTKSYTKCSCGIENVREGKIIRKPFKLQNSVETTLPDCWGVKKKRSIRSHTGSKKEKP